ncbi:ubiquitin-like protein [Vairimorpha apis BRL 01]|uniref:Ubiquitin-like protein n=1 Tax=Vairimorpha apis BRL 01 TaxID=1037528 RepID=T0L8G4_9MICR|nr:ubiquitin-like protein [Vairimorpha apis BRL 01]
MVKLSVVVSGKTFPIDVEDLEMTVQDFKKLVEEKTPENIKIPFDKQILYFRKDKFKNDSKLSDYINKEDEGARIFVLKETKTALNNKQESSNNNPYATNNQQQAKNPFIGNNQKNTSLVANHPYQQNNTSFNPYGNFQSPGMYYPQMQPPMNPAMGGPVSQEIIDMALGNPGMIDSLIDLQNPNLNPEEKEKMKKMYMELFKTVKENPSILNTMNQMGFQQPPYPPQMGYPQPPYPPQMGYPQPPYSPQMGYLPTYPPQMGYNPYYPGMPYGGTPQQQSPVLSREEYKKKFTEQINSLKEMGFNDEEENLTALIQGHGDINFAIDLLARKKQE